MSQEVVYLAADNSPHSVIADMLNQADDFEMVVLVALGHDNSVYVGHSDGRYLQKVGMLSFAQRDMMDKIANG